jgi:hypothetical protein
MDGTLITWKKRNFTEVALDKLQINNPRYSAIPPIPRSIDGTRITQKKRNFTEGVLDK